MVQLDALPAAARHFLGSVHFFLSEFSLISQIDKNIMNAAFLGEALADFPLPCRSAISRSHSPLKSEPLCVTVLQSQILCDKLRSGDNKQRAEKLKVEIIMSA